MAETGAVKLFNGPRGYGFIVPNAGGSDVFFHVTELRGTTTLTVGDQVEFERGEDKYGRAMARNVRPAR